MYLGAPGAAQTLGAKKRSILGLGLPSTMRLPSLGARTLSTASSASSAANVGMPTISAPQRLSAGSFSSSASNGSSTGTGASNGLGSGTGGMRQLIIAGAQGQTRRGSLVSTASAGSSLRPLSTTSTRSSLSAGSGESGNGRTASVRSGSVRWDEEGLETVRERRGAERAAAAAEAAARQAEEERKEKRTSRESRHSAEGRRRTSLKAVFGEALGAKEQEERMEVEEEVEEERRAFPILTIEEATADGHAFAGDESISEDGSEEMPAVAATPVKKARARPLSEQLLGRSRPKPMHEDDEGVSRFFSFLLLWWWLLCVLRTLCFFKFCALIRSGPLFAFTDP